MFEFKAKQIIADIGGVKVGGQPGENPTVLIGSIFYQGHKVVLDEKRGVFDRAEAEKLVNLQDEFSDKTGNPCMIDVVAMSGEAMEKYIDFVSGISDAPILIDGPSSEIRLHGYRYAVEAGLSDRIAYNSLMPDAKEEEINELMELKPKNIVILTYTMNLTTKGRVDSAKSLLRVCEKIGVKNVLIDTCVIDIPTLGLACKAIYSIKNEVGYPSGCAAHNAISTWRGLKTKMGVDAVKPAFSTANAFPVVIGADFILYGPIEHARIVFPAVSMIDAAYGFLLRERGIRVSKSHPLFKIA